MSNPFENCLPINAIAPANVDDGSFTSTIIDTKGYEYATFIYSSGDMGVDGQVTVLQVQESDSGTGSWTDIPGACYEGAYLPGYNDPFNSIYKINVNLDICARFIKIICTANNSSTGLYGSCVCLLGRPLNSPHPGAVTGMSGYSGWQDVTV